MTAPRVRLTGRRFGRLTPVLPAGKRNGAWDWLCECDCSPGTFRPVSTRSLLSGRSRSCGCMQKEQAATRAVAWGRANRRHGLSGTRTHISWNAMIQRCANPRQTSYEHYGGRGITVAPEWFAFDEFLADMGIRPPGRSLDRINNDGNYEPGNCRWATLSEQALNKQSPSRDARTGRYLPKGG